MQCPEAARGGSAAAVAARLAPGATGTDTGGSIRQPAALSGICGLKPTYGIVSRYGMIAFASSLDQGGPLARSAADLALLLNVMAGHDPRDSMTIAYLGLESGHEETNRRIVKGATIEEQVRAVRRAQAAGIKMSVMVLLGIAGRSASLEHARATARVVSEMDPRFLSCLCVTPVPGTPLHADVESGAFELPSPPEILEELRVLVEGLELSATVFRSNHASNWLPLGGRLPADKERLLAAIDLARAGSVPLKPDWLRGL